MLENSSLWRRCILQFSSVKELLGQENVWISGTCDLLLAVSKKGLHFGCGSNSCSQLCFNKEMESVSSFTKISSLRGYIKSGQLQLELFILFSRLEKVKSSHVGTTTMASSSLAAVQVIMFTHQMKQRSLVTPHSALLEIVSVLISSVVVHSQTRQICQLTINNDNFSLKIICLFKYYVNYNKVTKGNRNNKIFN